MHPKKANAPRQTPTMSPMSKDEVEEASLACFESTPSNIVLGREDGILEGWRVGTKIVGAHEGRGDGCLLTTGDDEGDTIVPLLFEVGCLDRIEKEGRTLGWSLGLQVG